MSIEFKVLGKIGRDNALFLRINSGVQLYRLQFDCGENVFRKLKQSEVKAIDYLFLSHLHVDHIAGFDYYFRRNFERTKPILIYGPEETISILHHRLQGFKWNLTAGSAGEFFISDITEENIVTSRFLTSESFSVLHPADKNIFNGVAFKNDDFTVEAALLNHRIPSAAYAVTEEISLNIDKQALDASGLAPGKWLEAVRDLNVKSETSVEIGDKKFTVGTLRSLLLRKRQGDKVSYLTDFLFDTASRKKAIELVKGSNVLVCESQYHSDDKELADKNYHLTAKQAAEIASEADVKKLILFHVSERYATSDASNRLLTEARNIFDETYFPEGWEET